MIDFWQEGRDNQVVIAKLHVPGKGEQEKFFLLSKWRSLADWPEVVSVEEGA